MNKDKLCEILNSISFSCPPQLLKYYYIFNEYKTDWLRILDFEKILAYYDIEKGFCEEFLRSLSVIKNDAILSKACYFFYYVLHFSEPNDYILAWKFKSEGALLEENIRMIPAIALLAGQPLHETGMKARRFDSEQIDIHKNQIRSIVKGEAKKHEHFFIGFKMVMWASFFMRSRIVRLGRLQYEIGIKRYPDIEKNLGATCAFVYIHIPGGESLSEEKVDASILLARDILPVYYPEIKDKKIVFCTNTWLLSPELRRILPESSNIVKFSKRFTVVRASPAKEAFLDYCFGVSGKEISDYSALPEDTFMRKEIKKLLLSGEELNSALGYFL